MPSPSALFIFCCLFAFSNLVLICICVKQKEEIDELKRQFLLLYQSQAPQKTEANNIVSKISADVGKLLRIWLIKAFSITGLIQIVINNAKRIFLRLIHRVPANKVIRKRKH